MEEYKDCWQGRNDGQEALSQRLFQVVNFEAKDEMDFVIHGFAVDEGVRRNKGRVGAAEAPNYIRRALANFPVVQSGFNLHDFGNIYCRDADLELAQASLAKAVCQALEVGAKSVVLGGGHEVTWGHYQGIRMAHPEKTIGVINFDAHFDNRTPEKEGYGTSGTGFWQIAKQDALQSLHIGIQRNSNTLSLFDSAHQLGMKYILAEEIDLINLPDIKTQIQEFSHSVDLLYLTICMDVFNASIAPGVSALAYNGIMSDSVFLRLLRTVLDCPNLVALDVAEVNPQLDIQDRTSRLAASLVNEWFMSL